jgi:predicted hydrocarbon binding protein
MSETQGITRLGFRVVLDSLEKNIGANGKNAILNFTKLAHYIKNPPEYDPDQRIPTEEYQRLWSGVRVILGNKGYNSLIYRAGVTLISEGKKSNPAYQALLETPQPPTEKLVTLVSTYLYAIGLKPEATMEHFPDKREIVIHRPECNECIEVCKNEEITKEITKPGCAFIVGAFTELTNVSVVLKSVVEETQCKLMGAPECTFRITYDAAQGE